MSAQATRAPGWLPGIGHLLPLGRRPLAFLTDLQSRHEIVRFDLGRLPVYFISDPELVHEVLVTRARHFERGMIFERTRPAVGNGIVTSEGTVHRTHRRLMQPAFNQERISGYTAIMIKNAKDLVQSWQPGDVVDIPTTMQQFTLTTVTESVFSAELAQPAVAEIQQLIPIFLEGVLPRTMIPRLLSRLPIPAIRRFDKAAQRIRTAIETTVEAYRVENSAQPDLVSMLLAHDTMTDRQLCDEVVTIVVAGTETPGTTLAWACYEVARNADVETQLLAEIDSVVGNGVVTGEHVAWLPYTRRVLTEALRLYSPLLFMRRALEETELGGVEIPKRTEVAYSPYALHRDPAIYRNPECFDPDRWLPEQESEIPRHAFMPFADGAHKCIGEHFAWAEMIIALATIQHRWQLRPLAGYQVRILPAEIPRPNQLLMTVTPRQTLR